MSWGDRAPQGAHRVRAGLKVCSMVGQMNLVLKGFRPAGSLKVRAHQLSHLIKKVQLAAVQEDNEMDEWGGRVSQMTRVVDTGNLCIYFQILFLFPLSSVVK